MREQCKLEVRVRFGQCEARVSDWIEGLGGEQSGGGECGEARRGEARLRQEG